MQQDYTPESFKKGQQFEKFVEEIIFTEDRYELITRTNSYEQNANRYAEDTLKPDFKFRCKETGQEFWIEAKYRSELFRDQIEALSFNQRDRFYNLEKEENIPVFVIIGYWGYANNPNALSLIPLKDYKYIKIFRSFLRENAIPLNPISNKTLGFKIPESDSKSNKSSSEETQENAKAEKHESERVSTFKRYNSKIIGLAAVGVLAIIMIIYGFGFSKEDSELSPEEQLKGIVTNYYQSMNSNQVEKLPQFLSPQVTSWYGEQNPSREWIYRNAKDHRGKYPYSSSDIDWKSFKVIPMEAGGYNVTYEMIYRSKENITDDYAVYDLKLHTQWDDNFKLKSITEIRNN